jgi:hypothetical protein
MKLRVTGRARRPLGPWITRVAYHASIDPPRAQRAVPCEEVRDSNRRAFMRMNEQCPVGQLNRGPRAPNV